MPAGRDSQPRTRRKLGRLTRLMAACAVVLTLWACGPVYIPVPPPAIQAAFTADTWTDSAGAEHRVWTTDGPARVEQSRATFYLFDQERSTGVITVAAPDGSFKAPALEGTEGDHILLYYRDSRGEVSASTCLILNEMRPIAGACP